MKPLETWFYAALLVVAIGLSWSSWTHEDVEEKVGAVVFDPGGPVRALRWSAEKNVATITLEGSGDDLTAWVEAGRRPRIEAPVSDDDDSAGDAPAEPSYGPAELTSFPGNDQSRKLAQAFAPLSALREFGAVDDATLEGMGLKDPKATLEVEAGSKTLTLQVGDKAYGSSDTYARDPASGAVYLLSSKVIGPLRGAESRLMERRLEPFKAEEVAMATLSAPGQGEARALHQGRHDSANAYWADPAEPEAVDTTRDALLDKAFQLRVTSYPKVGEEVAEDAVEPVAHLAFSGEGDEVLGTLDLGRQIDDAKSKPEEPVYTWWARSERTRGRWARVSASTAQELTDSLDALLSP